MHEYFPTLLEYPHKKYMGALVRASSSTSNSCVMVTGSGSGIGYAVTGRLLKDDHTVFGAAIGNAEAEKLANIFGANYFPVVMDVRDEVSAKVAAEQVTTLLAGRPLMGLLNIAGVITNGPLSLKFLSFLEALTTAMRTGFAPLGITAIAIAPGIINTPMVGEIQHELSRPPSLEIYTEQLRRFLAKTIDSATNGIPMSRVVHAVVEAIQTDKPAPRYNLHHSYFQDAILMRVLPIRIQEAVVARVLGLTAPSQP